MSTPQIQFIIDNAGHKSSVVVPYRQWEKFTSNYQKLLNKIRVLTGIKEGLNEVAEVKKTGRKLQKLSAFLSVKRS